MRSLANTRILIDNPVELDEYDEPIAGTGDPLGPYPASLIERRQITADPNDFEKVGFVRYANLRVKSTVPVVQDKIITDVKTNIKWQVESVTSVRTPMGPMDTIAQLRRLSS